MVLRPSKTIVPDPVRFPLFKLPSKDTFLRLLKEKGQRAQIGRQNLHLSGRQFCRKLERFCKLARVREGGMYVPALLHSLPNMQTDTRSEQINRRRRSPYTPISFLLNYYHVSRKGSKVLEEDFSLSQGREGDEASNV